jgi:hypothetical protein
MVTFELVELEESTKIFKIESSMSKRKWIESYLNKAMLRRKVSRRLINMKRGYNFKIDNLHLLGW